MGDNVYVENDVKIMPGVTIGNNIIIGTSQRVPLIMLWLQAYPQEL